MCCFTYETRSCCAPATCSVQRCREHRRSHASNEKAAVHPQDLRGWALGLALRACVRACRQACVRAYDGVGREASRTCPVMKDAWGETRKHTAAATSCGEPAAANARARVTAHERGAGCKDALGSCCSSHRGGTAPWRLQSLCAALHWLRPPRSCRSRSTQAPRR